MTSAAPRPPASSSALDLAESAQRRARLAFVLGRLLAEEPSPTLSDLVSSVPDLAPLAAPDPEFAAAFERLLLREVPPYESIFTSADGRRGGSAPAELTAIYERSILISPPQWRVASPDHLGLQLWAYGALCAEEAAAWDDDRRDRAARSIEVERELLVSHFGTWAEVAMAALGRCAIGSPYAALAAAVCEFVAVEAERIRPAPDHPGLPAIQVLHAPRRFDAASVARWLLAPARSGVYLHAGDLANAASEIGIPWRPSDPRGRLREIMQSATAHGEMAKLAGALRPTIEESRDEYARNEVVRAGHRRVWATWRMRAEASLELLGQLEHAGASVAPSLPERERVPAVLRVRSRDVRERTAVVDAILERLQRTGLHVVVEAVLPRRLARALEELLALDADEMLLSSEASDVSPRRGCTARLERRSEHPADADVILRLEPSGEGTLVEVETGRDHDTEIRVRECLGQIPEIF